MFSTTVVFVGASESVTYEVLFESLRMDSSECRAPRVYNLTTIGGRGRFLWHISALPRTSSPLEATRPYRPSAMGDKAMLPDLQKGFPPFRCRRHPGSGEYTVVVQSQCHARFALRLFMGTLS